jgi:hypothetical protein
MRPFDMQFAFTLLVVAMIVVPSVASQIGTAPPVRTRVDLVLIPTSVRDARGNLVSDLKANEFHLFEDGKEQTLTDASIDTNPPAVEVIRDSGMIAGPYAALSSSLDGFIAQFRKPDPEGIDGQAVRDLSDALYTSASYLEKRSPNRRKVIVAVVTGPPLSNSAVVPPRQVLNHMIESEVQLDFVLVGHFFPFAPVSPLRTYSDPTGGDVYRATGERELNKVLSQITSLLQHQYLLSYVPNNLVSGSIPLVRNIEVKTNRPGLKITYRRKYVQIP